MNLRVGAIVQARMTSSRLPGKVIMRLHEDKTVLECLIGRLRKAETLDGIIVACTNKVDDIPILKLCEKLETEVHKGDEADVLGRTYDAAWRAKLDIIVRITSDCPLVDPAMIDEMVRAFKYGGCEYLSNGHKVRMVTKGFDIEVFHMLGLADVHFSCNNNELREDVTPYFYTFGGRLRAKSWSPNLPILEANYSIDTIEDLERVRAAYAKLVDTYGEKFTYGEFCYLEGK